MLRGEIETALRDLEVRRGAANEDAMRVASEMIAGVRARGGLHYAGARLGLRAIYRCGGAAGIAAAALGTESFERVDKIVGPGNQFVTAAKAQLVGTVGIDMTAGPTELVVIADDSSNLELVQSDLDAQAEHGPDSAVICISVGCALDVRATLNFSVASVDDAILLADRSAPETVRIPSRVPVG